MISKVFQASWRRQFALLIFPNATAMSSLLETAEKLEAAAGFLEGLSPDVEAEREQGMFVASLAIDYALKVLDYFGLVDGDDPPMPVNLVQAKQAVGNLLAWVRENIQFGRMAAGEVEDDDTPSDVLEVDESPAEEASAGPFKLIVDEGTFTVSYRGKECFLGNTKPFWLLERLSRSRGTYIGTETLVEDVWHDQHVSQDTIHKTVSNLRKSLRKAGVEGVGIDGSQAGHFTVILS